VSERFGAVTIVSSWMSRLSMKTSERGTALLESAFTIVTLFLMIFGIIDFGRAVFVYHFVANAARDGVRYASVRGHSCASPMTNCGLSEAGAAIQTNLQSEAGAIGMIPTKLSVSTVPLPEATSPSVCATTYDYPGCTVQVTVSYPFQFIFPLLPTSPLNMSSTASAVITQ
jgi:Flp pilus assembly protein TadG